MRPKFFVFFWDTLKTNQAHCHIINPRRASEFSQSLQWPWQCQCFLFSQSFLRSTMMIIFYKLRASWLGFIVVLVWLAIMSHTGGQLFANIIVLLMKTNSISKLLMEMFMQDVSANCAQSGSAAMGKINVT